MLSVFRNLWIILKSSANSSVIPWYYATFATVHAMSSMLDVPQSAVSGVVGKCKHLGTAATQPWSRIPHEVTEQARVIEWWGCQENFYQDVFRPFLFQHDCTPVHKAHKVHKEMIKWVWCRRTWLACTEHWPEPHWTTLGCTGMKIVS